MKRYMKREEEKRRIFHDKNRNERAEMYVTFYPNIILLRFIHFKVN